MKLSLRSVLMIPLVLQLIGLTTTLTYISLHNSQRAIATAAERLADTTNQYVIDELDGYVEAMQRANEHYLNTLTATADALSTTDNRYSLDQLHEQLIAEFQQQKPLSAMLLGLSTGEIRTAYRVPTSNHDPQRQSEIRAGVVMPSSTHQLVIHRADAGGALGQAIGTQEIQEDHDRAWFEGAARISQASVNTTQFTLATSDDAIYAYTPFNRRAAGLRGVIAAEIHFEQLNVILGQLQLGPDEEVFIMSRSGALIAQSNHPMAPERRRLQEHSDPSSHWFARHVGEAEQPKARQQQAMESSYPHIRGTTRFLQEQTQDFKAIYAQQQYVAQINGDRRFLHVSPYGDGTLDWLVVTTLAEDNLLKDARISPHRVVQLSLLILGSSIALSYGLVSWIAGSLERLSEAAQGIEHGAALPRLTRAGHVKVKEFTLLQQTLFRLARRSHGRRLDTEAQLQRRTLKLQRSELALKEAQRVARVGSWILDVKTGDITWSHELLKIYGLQESEPPVNRTAFLNYLPSQDRAVLDSALQQAITTGQPYAVEHQFAAHPDGATLYVISRGEPVFNDQGQVVEIVGTATDISDRKRSELLLQHYAEDLAEWRDRYEAAARASGQVLFEYDLATDHDTWGPNTDIVLGYELDQMPNGIEAYTALIHPEDRPRFREVLARDKASTEPYRVEFRFRRPDGSYMWVKEQGITRYSAQGDPIQVIGYIADIGARKRTELALTQQNELFRQVTETIREAFYVFDLDRNRYSYVSPAHENIWGLPVEATYQDPEVWKALVHPDDLAYVLQDEVWTQQHNSPSTTEYRIIRASGEVRWIEDKTFPIQDQAGRVHKLIGVEADITARKTAELELRRRNEQLNRLASIDALTQVANRRQLQDSLEVEWQRHQQTQKPLTLIMVDIDHFKAFNDRYGHLAGDDCLRQVAQALQRCVSAQDLVSRYGGEEFSILLPKTDSSGARAMARRLQNAIAALKIAHPYASDTGTLTISIGVAVFQTINGLTTEAALTEADKALYQAKQARNTYCSTLVS